MVNRLSSFVDEHFSTEEKPLRPWVALFIFFLLCFKGFCAVVLGSVDIVHGFCIEW